jgi:hypothetical protein
MAVRRFSKIVVVTVLIVVILLNSAGVAVASAQTSQKGTLTVAYIMEDPDLMIAVEGVAFSPGGTVYLAFYDRWGASNQDHVWTVATAGDNGSNGGPDPVRGFSPVGSISVTLGFAPGMDNELNGLIDPSFARGPGRDQSFDSLRCGRDLMVRAYDAQADAWSNVIDVLPAC